MSEQEQTPSMDAQLEQLQRNRMRYVLYVTAFFVISLSVICVLTILLVRDALQGERKEPKALLIGATVETLVELPGDEAYPEALTIGPDGNIYVASFCTGTIWRVTPHGELETWLQGGGDHIEAASGLIFGPDGFLYVIDRGECDPRAGSASIKRVSPDAQAVETVGNMNENDVPNSLAFDDMGTLYVTDTRHGTVRYLSDEGKFEVWWALPDGEDAGPTGLVYDTQTDTMLVADTESGTIFRVGFDEERRATDHEVVYKQEDRELDGLAMDEDGHVFVTLYDTNTVGMLQPSFGMTLLAEDFRQPSDVAYADGKVYVVNFDSLALAPLIGILIDPSLPFTVDVITLPEGINN